MQPPPSNCRTSLEEVDLDDATRVVAQAAAKFAEWRPTTPLRSPRRCCRSRLSCMSQRIKPIRSAFATVRSAAAISEFISEIRDRLTEAEKFVLPDEVLGLVNSPQIRSIMDPATAMTRAGIFRLPYPTVAMQISNTIYVLREMPGSEPNDCPAIQVMCIARYREQPCKRIWDYGVIISPELRAEASGEKLYLRGDYSCPYDLQAATDQERLNRLILETCKLVCSFVVLMATRGVVKELVYPGEKVQPGTGSPGQDPDPRGDQHRDPPGGRDDHQSVEGGGDPSRYLYRGPGSRRRRPAGTRPPAAATALATRIYLNQMGQAAVDRSDNRWPSQVRRDRAGGCRLWGVPAG
jgi:hypothetical protein